MEVDRNGDEEASSSSQQQPYWASKANVAPIKAEFVDWSKLRGSGSGNSSLPDPPQLDNDDVAEGRSAPALDKPADLSRSVDPPRAGSPPRKKARSDGAVPGGGGMNKGRKFKRATEEIRLCNATARGQVCKREQSTDLPPCKNSHDLKAYLHESKEHEILIDIPENLAVGSTSTDRSMPCPVSLFTRSIDIYGTDIALLPLLPACQSFSEFGACPFGFRCRLLSSHVERHEDPTAGFQSSGLSLMYDFSKLRSIAPPSLSTSSASDEELLSWVYETRGELNVVTPDKLYTIRKIKTEDLPITRAYLTSIGEPLDTRNLNGGRGGRGGKRGGRGRGGRGKDGGWQDRGNLQSPQEAPNGEAEVDPTTNGAGFDEPRATADDLLKEEDADGLSSTAASADTTSSSTSVHPNASARAAAEAKDTPDVPVRPAEKKRLNFENKLYLAPLTTVGNLPFRRLCVSYGCDITCGEMGLAQEYMTGNKSEWSLVRRHPSEKIFGVQLAANKVQTAMSATELIRSQVGDVDFIDLNLGCPIDLVVKKGAGSALLDNASKLGKILAGMNRAAGEVPVTIKMRTGIKTGVNTTHKLMPRIVKEYGVGAATLHGRTQQQRYSKLADYSYIKQCVDGLRASAEEMDVSAIPFFGNGDAYDHRSYWENVEAAGVDGIMIARGALIKPWLFTEIKEKRDWDISSRERLDMIGNLAKFGMEHWGSDTMGINTTRRFLCEAMSFTYRYVPVGLLERLPARMNDRPYPFKGRDELETLLASSDSEDWVKISEMFLGPRAPEFKFVAKHKSNSYSKEGEESYNG